jgi:hypothetical protein
MAKPIVVTIPHDLGRVETLRRVRIGLVRAIAALVGKIQVEQTPWTEDGAFGEKAKAFVEQRGTLLLSKP